MTTKTINVDALTRVEGEGGLHIRVRDGVVEDVELRIFEAPRFFEALLRGRSFHEVPDLTARICGICPVAYQMTAVSALETGLGIVVPEPISRLRRLLYCGEWIESHALHIYMLQAPDLLGYPGVVELARDQAALVQRGLRLKRAGNRILTLLGGRAIHPINVRVGGFYRLPKGEALGTLNEELRWARDAAQATLEWVCGLPLPRLEVDHADVALHDPNAYPMDSGRLCSSAGLDISAREMECYLEEQQVPHSTALHSTLRGHGSYRVGPLARYNLNAEQMTSSVRALLRRFAVPHPCHNPFFGIVIRAAEVLQACEEAVALSQQLASEVAALGPVPDTLPRAVTCYAFTEAPRGVLYHRYDLATDGSIVAANIVAPTSQNQRAIEAELRQVVQEHLALPHEALTALCEQVVRNHDPCISCAAHFLHIHME